MSNLIISGTTPTACGCCGEASGAFLIIPLFSPYGPGGWYASLAIATADMAFVSRDCLAVVYFLSGIEDDVSVSTSPTEVDVTMANHDYGGSTEAILISLNLASGATLSIAYVVTTNSISSGDLGTVSLILYSDNGSSITLVDFDEQSISTPTFSHTVNFTIPAAGVYQIYINTQRYDGYPASGINLVTSTDFVFTSTGAISANRVRALYDIGGADPGTLDCT